jgi:hypothetical protein
MPAIEYRAFCDLSGGSGDDSTLGIGHYDPLRKVTVLDLLVNQGGKPPFDPRRAVAKFAEICKRYRCYSIVGDRYSGLTFQFDFQSHGISYRACPLSKSELYENLEVKINTGECELLDLQPLIEQLLTLTLRGSKIDHAAGLHDDWANSLAGVVYVAQAPVNVDFSDIILGTREALPPGVSLTETESEIGGDRYVSLMDF